MKSATVSAFALSTMLFSASTSFAQELATKDRIGLADAPKSLVVRLTNDSPNNSDPAIAEGYQKLFVDFIKKHPDWKLQMQFMSSDIGTEQAKMLEQAKAGNAPDCAAVDSFVLSQFMVNHVLADFTPYFRRRKWMTFSPSSAVASRIRTRRSAPGGGIPIFVCSTATSRSLPMRLRHGTT